MVCGFCSSLISSLQDQNSFRWEVERGNERRFVNFSFIILILLFTGYYCPLLEVSGRFHKRMDNLVSAAAAAGPYVCWIEEWQATYRLEEYIITFIAASVSPYPTNLPFLIHRLGLGDKSLCRPNRWHSSRQYIHCGRGWLCLDATTFPFIINCSSHILWSYI